MRRVPGRADPRAQKAGEPVAGDPACSPSSASGSGPRSCCSRTACCARRRRAGHADGSARAARTRLHCRCVLIRHADPCARRARVQRDLHTVVLDSLDVIRGGRPRRAEMARADRDVLADRYPWLVAEDNDGTVIGFAYACQHRERAAYRWAADVAVYVATGTPQTRDRPRRFTTRCSSCSSARACRSRAPGSRSRTTRASAARGVRLQAGRGLPPDRLEGRRVARRRAGGSSS